LHTGLDALYKTTLDINVQRDVPEVLQSIVRRAAGLIGSQIGGLYLLQPDGDTLEMVASHQLPQEYVGATVRRGEGVAGAVIQSGR